METPRSREHLLELWRIAYPLVISSSSSTVMMFSDRLFLSLYSKETLAASLPGGLSSFVLQCLFFGTVGYVSPMVAQHLGAGRPDRGGAITWQGLYVALFGALALQLFIPLGPSFFALVGHSAELVELESQYFAILLHGAFFNLGANALSSFFSGIGRTKIVMVANPLGMVLNLPLSVLLIFGYEPLGLQAQGIAGAAYGTVASSALTFFILLRSFLSPAYRVHRTRNWAPDRGLLAGLWRFGLPSGVQMLFSVGAFNFYVLVLGGLGIDEQAAVNITLSWDLIAFLPQLGFGVAVASLVGRYVGAGDYDTAVSIPLVGMILAYGYGGFMALTFFFFPGPLITLFGGVGDHLTYERVHFLATAMLRLTSLYIMADATIALYRNALHGAGDTRFCMWMASAFSWFGLALPSLFLVRGLGVGLLGAWSWLTGYLAVMAVVYILRFRSGRWRHLSVIVEDPSA
ncbi:MAG: hypothetical protein A2284_14850 [Deltaproteobacteria bacterium RIFOXYA12_FULL_61_11]|nr:MAG: hypothetical protein A2284_14850 [Deltaproteobacteria bacterium RIFOXYA12_FULL_61_11]